MSVSPGGNFPDTSTYDIIIGEDPDRTSGRWFHGKLKNFIINNNWAD